MRNFIRFAAFVSVAGHPEISLYYKKS